MVWERGFVKQDQGSGAPGERQKPPYNVTFGILSALAILMIVAGHSGYDIFTVGGLFPYYSFHVPLFMFISGYFYRDEEESNPLAYLKKKAKRLLLPYFIWNAVYGLLAAALRAFGGFSMGEAVSLKTLFFTPFLNGYQFILNYAAWFVPVLFIVEVMNLCMRLLLGRLHINSEWLILIGTLAVGMLVVQFAIEGRVWGLYKTPGRILFLYPCFQMGQFYKKKLESRDTLGNVPYFAVVLGVQVLLQLCASGLVLPQCQVLPSGCGCRSFFPRSVKADRATEQQRRRMRKGKAVQKRCAQMRRGKTLWRCRIRRAGFCSVSAVILTR